MNAFAHEPRQRLSDRERARLFLERGGKCHRCSRMLRPGDDWTVEHVTALENGGNNDWGNLDVTCAWCRPVKDREDHKRSAHAKRVSVNHVIHGRRKDKRRGFRTPTGARFDWFTGRYSKHER